MKNNPRYSKVDQLDAAFHRVASEMDGLRINITEAIIYLEKAQAKLNELLPNSPYGAERDGLVNVQYQVICALEKLRAKE